MLKQVNNFLAGTRLSKDFHSTMTYRGCVTNPSAALEMRQQGLEATPHIKLLGTEYRALNTTESGVEGKATAFQNNRGVFSFIDNVVNDNAYAIGHFTSLDAIQKPVEGDAWNDNVDADVNPDTNNTIFDVEATSSMPRYTFRTELTGDWFHKNVDVATPLFNEIDSAIAVKMGDDAMTAIASAATATGSAFAADDVVAQFMVHGSNYRFVGSPAQVVAVRRALVEAGSAELTQYVNAFSGASAGYGWIDGKVALVLPMLNISRDEYTQALDGKIVFNASAVGQTLALDADKFAAS